MNELPLLEMQALASNYFDLNNISVDFIAKFIHSSLSFESDLMSLDEVKKLLNEDVSDENKKNLLVQNHKNAFMYIVDLIKTNQQLEENKLKDLHEILMNEIGVGGLYRNVDISINGSNHTPPSHIKVYDRMKKYFDTITNFSGNVFELIAYSHLQLVKIHPFLDGNGRCARLMLTYQLMKHNLAPIVIPYTNKERYFSCIEDFKVNKNITPFIEYIKELEYKELNL